VYRTVPQRATNAEKLHGDQSRHATSKYAYDPEIPSTKRRQHLRIDRQSFYLLVIIASVALVLGKQLFFDVGRHHVVILELHRIGSTALGQ